MKEKTKRILVFVIVLIVLGGIIGGIIYLIRATVKKYNCVNGKCIESSTGNDLAICKANCPTPSPTVKKYNCVNGKCIESSTGNDLAICKANCPTPSPTVKKYNCDNGKCTESSTGNDLAICKANCPTPSPTVKKYNCVNGKCTESSTGNDLAICKANCPESPKFKVGDSVYVSAQASDPFYSGNGCVVSPGGEQGTVEVCDFFQKDAEGGVQCGEMKNVGSNELKKISPIQVPCRGKFPGCSGILSGCNTTGSWPQSFDSQSDCEDWAGKNSTWGKCVEIKTQYLNHWVLSCKEDSDCGTNRKCLTDTNSLNITGKTCSCKTVADCQYPDSQQIRCDPVGLGKMSCPKVYPIK